MSCSSTLLRLFGPLALLVAACGAAPSVSRVPDAGGSLPDAGGTLPEVGGTLPDVGGSAPDAVSSTSPDAVTVDVAAADGTSVDAAAATGPDANDAGSGRVPIRALAVTVGQYHSCALLEDHRVKCWGDNSVGQLGQGDTRTRGALSGDMGDALPAVDLGTGRTATAVAAGRYATCAILDDGALKCWGHPWPAERRGDLPGQMGDNLPAMDLGAGRTAKKIAIGFYDACALTDAETLRCWGTSDAPTAVPSPAGVAVKELVSSDSVLGLFDDGSVRGLSPANTAPPALVDLGANQRARFVGGSTSTNCALLESGGVKCWGRILTGVPPATAMNLSAVGISAFGDTCGILGDGSVRCWGGSSAGANWSEPPAAADVNGGVVARLGQAATAIAGGAYNHGCALLLDGAVKCWGWTSAATAAVGAGPDSGLVGGSLRAVDLGTRPAP